MPDHSVHKASDLAQDERLVRRKVVGGALSNDETISVNAYRCHTAPTGAKREALRREIVAQALEIGSRGQDTWKRKHGNSLNTRKRKDTISKTG